MTHLLVAAPLTVSLHPITVVGASSGHHLCNNASPSQAEALSSAMPWRPGYKLIRPPYHYSCSSSRTLLPDLDFCFDTDGDIPVTQPLHVTTFADTTL